jgi:hypothetical protein
MNSKIMIRLMLLLLLGCNIQLLNAQTGIAAGGGNATGSGGSVSYSIGQVFYMMNTGTTGSVLQGVQQPWEISQTLYNSQTLTFSTGWNLFSFNIVPVNLDMKVNFQSLIDAGRLIKIQNEVGEALEDLGFFGGWTNYIGDIGLTEGYKAKMSLACQLTRQGSAATLPFTIPLKAGWNIIGFPRTEAADGMEVVQQLIDGGTLIKVQDELGYSIEDLGFFGGWTNSLGNFLPGKGYKVKCKTAVDLVIQASYAKAGHIVRQVAPVVHFRTVTEGNGVDHMNIHLVGLKEEVWHPGDEIGVFDGNLCVGSVALLPIHIENRMVSIAASASDGMDGEGFTDGRPFTLKLWNRGSGIEYRVEPEILKGTPTFLKHESTLASVGNLELKGLEDLKLIEQRHVSCYPNPTRGQVTLRIDSFPEEGVLVEVMNALGQLIMIKTSDKSPSVIDLSGNVSGVYFLNIRCKEWHDTERIILR